jgi:hypothetical protein
MIRWIAIITAMLAASSVSAQLLLGVTQNNTGGNGPPPACSNSLNFTQACNSQYVGIF